MRFTAAEGHRILNGQKTVHYLPTDTLDIALCPVQPGDLVPLHFPEPVRDSYGQTILDRNGDARVTYVHDHQLRILHVNAEDADGLPGSAVYEIRFRLEVVDHTLYMARGAGHTTALARAIDDAPYVDPDLLNPRWTRYSTARHARDRGKLNKAPGNRKAA